MTRKIEMFEPATLLVLQPKSAKDLITSDSNLQETERWETCHLDITMVVKRVGRSSPWISAFYKLNNAGWA